MLFYYLFWMIMGFIIHFYITFGTNLLTGGPAQIWCFMPISVFRRKGISNGVQTEWNLQERDFLEQTWSRGLGVKVKKQSRRPRGWRAPPLLRASPISWAPRASTNLLLPPIYTHVPRKHQKRPRKTISTAITFCIHEIPSWSLHRRSAGGEIDHGGPLHHLQGLSDELWVVYHRPSGP